MEKNSIDELTKEAELFKKQASELKDLYEKWLQLLIEGNRKFEETQQFLSKNCLTANPNPKNANK